MCRRQGEADAAEEPDYMIFVTQGIYKLRSGSAEVALEYLNNAIKLDPEDELPFIVRSQCLNRSVIKYILTFVITVQQVRKSCRSNQ